MLPAGGQQALHREQALPDVGRRQLVEELWRPEATQAEPLLLLNPLKAADEQGRQTLAEVVRECGVCREVGRGELAVGLLRRFD